MLEFIKKNKKGMNGGKDYMAKVMFQLPGKMECLFQGASLAYCQFIYHENKNRLLSSTM